MGHITKNIHEIEQLLAEDVEPDEIQINSESIDADLEHNMLLFDEEGQVSVSLEANVESIVELEKK